MSVTLGSYEFTLRYHMCYYGELAEMRAYYNLFQYSIIFRWECRYKVDFFILSWLARSLADDNVKEWQLTWLHLSLALKMTHFLGQNTILTRFYK